MSEKYSFYGNCFIWPARKEVPWMSYIPQEIKTGPFASVRFAVFLFSAIQNAFVPSVPVPAVLAIGQNHSGWRVLVPPDAMLPPGGTLRSRNGPPPAASVHARN